MCKYCKLQPERKEHFILFSLQNKKRRLELAKDINKNILGTYNIPNCKRFTFLMNLVMMFLYSACLGIEHYNSVDNINMLLKYYTFRWNVTFFRWNMLSIGVN